MSAAKAFLGSKYGVILRFKLSLASNHKIPSIAVLNLDFPCNQNVWYRGSSVVGAISTNLVTSHLKGDVTKNTRSTFDTEGDHMYSIIINMYVYLCAHTSIYIFSYDHTYT